MIEHSELIDTTPMNDTEELLRSVSERPPSDAPYLAESTARYILHQPKQNKTKNERNIQDALYALPLRITRLLYDLAILSRGGYLDNLDENWTYLGGVPDFLSYVSRYSHGRETTSNRKDLHFNLGFDMGLGLSALTGTISEDKRASEFLAGFTTAYSTDNFQQIHTSNNSAKENNKINPERKQVLEQYGIEPTNYLEKLIEYHNVAWSDVRNRDPLPIKEATQEYVEERLGKWFGKCSYLRKELEREWKSIDKANTPGMNAEEALEALWKLETGDNADHETSSSLITSEAIAKRAGKNKQYEKSVSQVLNQLSVEGKEPSEEVIRTFEAEEIVYYHGREWNLTGYGQLLLYHVYEKGKDPAWIQKAAVGTSLPTDQGFRTKKDTQILKEAIGHFYRE